MRILIVSGQAYSKTNRSIDTITEYFIEKNFSVEHLVFGINKLKIPKKLPEINLKNFKQLYSTPSYFSYVGAMGKMFPEFLLGFIRKMTLKTVKGIDFSKYDLIVLETGKPLFLMDIIPKDIPVICRQSDPLEISIRSERKYFKKIEREAIERSIFTLVAHIKAAEEYNQDKIIDWKSGFQLKKLENTENKSSGRKQVCYMGMFQLDMELLKILTEKNPEVDFNIVGNYKDELKLSNVIFHGYLGYDEYMKILKNSICFFIPYHISEVSRMKTLGLTSKFYIPMSMGIPVLSREYGNVVGDMKEYNIFTYSTAEEAEKKLGYILSHEFKKTEEIDKFLESLTIESRKKEFEKILKEYGLEE